MAPCMYVFVYYHTLPLKTNVLFVGLNAAESITGYP